MRKLDPKSWIIAALAAANALTLAFALSARPAQAVMGFGDFTKLLGIVDLEQRMRGSGVALVADAVELRKRAVLLMAELSATNQRLQITDADLSRLNRELNELREYRDVVKKLTGR